MQILHVDDEADIREIARLSLEMNPANVVTSAESGMAALQILENLIPDLILLDVMMPEMDGPGLFSRLKTHENFTDIPVIFMTAAAQQQTVDDLLALGARGVIRKPFDPMELAEQVETFL